MSDIVLSSGIRNNLLALQNTSELMGATQNRLATGKKVRKRTLDARDELTGQEKQIAGLARDGLSNPEIGARLFLSSRTVEWHLGKVFAKLRITSRMDLRDALPRPDQEATPA